MPRYLVHNVLADLDPAGLVSRIRKKMMPPFLKIDKSTETGKMTTVQVYLINKFEVIDDPVEAVIYGPSTSKKIERWWRD